VATPHPITRPPTPDRVARTPRERCLTLLGVAHTAAERAARHAPSAPARARVDAALTAIDAAARAAHAATPGS